MRCDFNDGLQVSYTGRLRISKGDEINVFLDHDDIPATLQGRLHEAEVRDDCGDLRSIADEVTNMFGKKVPEQ